MTLTLTSTFQIFPNKTVEKLKNCVKMRDELLKEILEKYKVGDGAEETMS